MNSDDARPSDFNLPHDDFRRHQLESIVWVMGLDGFGFVEAPTGSGKTSLAAATSVRNSVIALCKTKNLQQINYGETYGAKVLFGRSNYLCVHPLAEDGATCEECSFVLEGESMHACPYAEDCEYLRAKSAAQGSPFASLNYAYYLSSGWPRDKYDAVLFCDEAHRLPDVVLDRAGCRISEETRRRWNLPKFPEITGSGGALLGKPDPVLEASAWLEAASKRLNECYRALSKSGKGKAAASCFRDWSRVRGALSGLRRCGFNWFIRSGLEARRYKGKTVPGFVLRSYTARRHFPGMFLNHASLVAMSATIGNVETFAEELGVKEYQFHTVPHQYPPECRQVQVLDAPRMSHKSRPSAYEKQADLITKTVKGCPPAWSGIIHVTRKTEAKELADRLARRGLQDRIWVMPGYDGSYVPTDQQVAAWNKRRTEIPNSLCVAYSLADGYDGLEEKIDIVAKVQFGYLGDDYVRERMRYSHKLYLLRTAWTLEQSLGRTRRGREQDYDIGVRKGCVAICDGNWTRVRSYLSESLKEALVE